MGIYVLNVTIQDSHFYIETLNSFQLYRYPTTANKACKAGQQKNGKEQASEPEALAGP